MPVDAPTLTTSNDPLAALEAKACPNLSRYRAMEYELDRIRLRVPSRAKGAAPVITVDEQTHLDAMDRQWAKLTATQKQMLAKESACSPS